ncbi:MAG: response regulator [Gammaproteobacteria bacterium TMED92]|nr:MAG: response regulator [Gammaproteobacteria bacterium TMED92]
MPNILIVEDNEMNRDMLSRRLKRKGYDIAIAVDGQEGIDMMRADKPDLVLMDMGLPIMDGWTATSTAKADDDLKSIPIIALTAHALEQDRIKAMDAGADDFDTKPVNLNRLLEKISALL